MYQRNYCFGGVGFSLSAPVPIGESDALRLFSGGEADAGYRITLRLSDAFPQPPEGLYVHTRRVRGWRAGPRDCRLLYYYRSAGEPEVPYCYVERSGMEVAVDWLPALSSGLHAQQILESVDLFRFLLEQGGVVLHASYILHRGRSLLFSAPSGTGKSTQAALWARLRGAEIVNGDRALLRAREGCFQAHGICFSGTSGICGNRSAPLSALVVLGQAERSTCRRLGGLDAFRALLPQCAYRTWNPQDVAAATDTLSRLIGETPVLRLDCLPDESAVKALEECL